MTFPAFLRPFYLVLTADPPGLVDNMCVFVVVGFFLEARPLGRGGPLGVKELGRGASKGVEIYRLGSKEPRIEALDKRLMGKDSIASDLV